MVKETIAYEDSYGNLFNSKEDAIESQSRQDLFVWVATQGIGAGGMWGSDMIANVLWEYRRELRDILQSEGFSNE